MSAYLGTNSSDSMSARVRELKMWQSEVEMKLNFLRERTESPMPTMPGEKKGFGAIAGNFVQSSLDVFYKTVGNIKA